MKRILLALMLISVLLFSASCGQAVAGVESSVSGMNDITRLKITSDQVAVRSGCSNNTNVLQTMNKDTKLDVLGKVADWYAVKLPNDIGFVPQKNCTPIVPDGTIPGASVNYPPAGAGAMPGASQGNAPVTPSVAAPGNAPGTPSVAAPGAAQGAKQKTPDTTQSNNNALTAQEQQMLNLVNQARAQSNMPALQVDMELTKMARVKSQDMIDNNYFSHNSPKYGSPFDMMKSFGISYVYAGENIAGNQTVPKAHEALMNSPGHRKNILSADYTHIGIGIRAGGQYGSMFTQDFISKPK